MASTTIHVTETLQFLRCRRQWDLQAHNRQGLTRIGPPAKALNLGAAVHHMFDQASQGQDPLQALEVYFEETEERIRAEYQSAVGAPISDYELTDFADLKVQAKWMAENYYDTYGWENPLGPGWRYVQTEVAFSVPIPGTRGRLAGTFDGLVEDTRSGDIWGIEHKSYSNTPKEEDLRVHHQMTLYTWAAQRLFGREVKGFLYDGIRKKKSRSGEDLLRLKIWIPQASVDFWNGALPHLYREMTSPRTQIYPTFRFEGCWDCGVRDLCHAIQFDEDLEHVMRRYRRGEGHRTVKSLLRKPIAVTTVSELTPVQHRQAGELEEVPV